MGFVKHGQGEIVPNDEDVKKTASRDEDRQERIQRLEEENDREDG